MTSGSSGFDLCAALEEGGAVAIRPGGYHRVSTGIRFQIPEGYEGQIRSRSGLAAKHGVAVLNAPGTIDADFRGVVEVVLVNHGKSEFWVAPGDRIAQIVFAKVEIPLMLPADDLAESQRGEAGFGSTGV